jgi:phenylpropionate dioxygenase-like ring-hydroxylating dioxygenase large terminal subunit
MKALRNVWYVAAWAHEVAAGAILARRILGEALVLYRAADGAPHAAADRCPHRLAPLSAGRMEAGNLRCMYHGLLFEPGGRCIEVPGQDMISPHLKLTS